MQENDWIYLPVFTITTVFVVLFLVLLAVTYFILPSRQTSNTSYVYPTVTSFLQPSPTQRASSEQTFSACSGIDQTEKVSVAYHRIVLARSDDGLHFNRLNKIISDRASVPAIMIGSDGNLRIYFVQVSCRELNMRNTPVVAESSDNGKTWVYKRLHIDAPKEASRCLEPGGNPPPVDPFVVLMPDSSYRLYATCPNTSTTEQIPMSFVFTSADGITFSSGKSTYTPKEKNALDPVILKTDKTWHLYNGTSAPGGPLHATSSDGITFTETNQFCPFKFTDTKGVSRCYIIGKTGMVLANPKRYRLYLFGNTQQEGFKSIVSTDGENWTMEQKTGEYIFNVDNNSQTEYYELASPTVVQLKDGTYLMAYETVIPGTPQSVLGGQNTPNGR